MKPYAKLIEAAKESGGLLDAMLAIQKEYGYLSEEAILALAAAEGVSPAQMYDTASFYSMLRFAPPAKTAIRVCRGTACHSGGNEALIRAIEEAVGVEIGHSSEDGSCSFDYVECLGQCQSAPNVMINGKLYSGVSAETAADLLKEGGVI